MFLITFLGFLVITSALPAQQLLTPAAPLTAIHAPNHILILTPQAQVQLDPTLKYAQPLLQNLAPIASPIEQTVVYLPNENLLPKAVQQGKQLETSNITNVVNQFVTAGQTVQAELQALQQQLSQGLENIIQPGQQKMEIAAGAEALKSAPAAVHLVEAPRQEAGRFYSVPAAIPQFYSNFEVIHAPLNPLFTIQPLQAIRARSVVHPEDKVVLNAPQPLVESLNLAKQGAEGVQQEALLKSQENENQARNVESPEAPIAQPLEEIPEDKSLKVQKESAPVPVENSQFGKFLGSLDNSGAIPIPLNKKEAKIADIKEEAGSDMPNIAEAIPAGLAISGEGGLAQAQPIASAIAGKDGIAYTAPSGTAIAGSSDIEKNSMSS